MASISNNRASFFDDDDLNVKFEWEKLEKTSFRNCFVSKPLVQGFFDRVQDDAKKTGFSGNFALFNRCIIQLKGNTSRQGECVLDITNAKLKFLPEGFTLQKNGVSFNFTSKNEPLIKAWIDHLKGICVLTTFHNDYKAIKMIGRGTFAKVYLVESLKTKEKFAVKAFTKENVIFSHKQKAKPSMLNEIDILRCLSHENIIKLYEVYESEKSIYLVFELIEGKALQDVLDKSFFKVNYSETKVISIIKSILEALVYLSTKGIMHRDLKPDNILIDKNDKVKIVDFGLATFVSLDKYIFKKCGTPGYIAPEVFRYDEDNSDTDYDERCDVFSVGCMLFHMLFGYPLFKGLSISEILQNNRKYTKEFESIALVKLELKKPYSKISKEGLNLLLELLEFEHKQRIRAEKALQHNYFIHFKGNESPTKEDEPNRSEVICGSPRKISDDSSQIMLLSKQNSSNFAKEKYEQKDSLYIDVGQPLINGRTDTISLGASSKTNSIQFCQTPKSRDSNPNSLSKFANGGKNTDIDFRKAVIMKNVLGVDSDSESPRAGVNRERSYSSGDRTGFGEPKEKSPDNIEDVSTENSQVQNNIDKMINKTPEKHPSKLLSTGRQILTFETRSAGNSPKNSGIRGVNYHSPFGIITKSPKK